jgi:hypothetical protein
MTTARLRAALASYAVLAALALPLTARVPETGFQVRHAVWLALAALAVKSWLAWLSRRSS